MSKNFAPTSEKLNQIKSKGDFSNVRSNYILREFFNYITKNKTLRIVKLNKNIQKRLDISINDYKEYSQIHSSIEIEIKFDDDKYGKFINIYDKVKKYFHIYFTYYNNSKEEINRNILKMNEKVKMINVIIDEKIISFINLFRDSKNISSITFKKFVRNNIRDMSFMFDKCESLKELNFNSFNTSNVTNMLYMFSGCSKLK